MDVSARGSIRNRFTDVVEASTFALEFASSDNEIDILTFYKGEALLVIAENLVEETNEFQKVVDYITTGLQLVSDNPIAIERKVDERWRYEYILGTIELKSKNLDNALDHFEEAIKRNPRTEKPFAAWFQAAHEVGIEDMVERGIDLFQEGERLFNHSSFIKHVLGQFLEFQGRYDKATYKFKEALEIDPELQFRAHLNRLIAQRAERTDITKKIENVLNSIESSISQVGDAANKLDMFLNIAAPALSVSKSNIESIAKFIKIIYERESGNSFSFDHPKALSLIQYVMAILVLMQVIQTQRGFALQKKGSRRLQRELEKLRLKSKKSREEHSKLLTEIGRLFETNKQIERAIESYRSAIIANPDNIDAKINLSKIMFQLKEFNRALSLLESVLKIEPNNIVAKEMLDKIKTMNLSRRSFFANILKI